MPEFSGQALKDRFKSPEIGDTFMIIGGGLMGIGWVDYLTVSAIEADKIIYLRNPFQGEKSYVSMLKTQLDKVQVLKCKTVENIATSSR